MSSDRLLGINNLTGETRGEPRGSPFSFNLFLPFRFPTFLPHRLRGTLAVVCYEICSCAIRLWMNESVVVVLHFSVLAYSR